MPFITDLMDLSVLREEYRENKFETCFDDLYTRYTKVRRLRRDGNCFYRAFLFQVFEYFIKNCSDSNPSPNAEAKQQYTTFT